MLVQNVTIKQCVNLALAFGFRKCELWTTKDYAATHTTRSRMSHMIATKKINMLLEIGVDYSHAYWAVMMEGRQKLNKRNMALLGLPIWTGTLSELYNSPHMWNKMVDSCHVKGLFRKTVQIIIEKENR